MILTSAQLTTIKNDIAANSDLNSQPDTPDGNFEIARLYNLKAVPDYWVWRTSVSKAELTQTASVDGTTFNWSGTGFIARTQGEQFAFSQLFDGLGFCNPSLISVRQAFVDIFSGAVSPAPENRTHMATVSRRTATRCEKVLATGTGSTVSPSLMGVGAEGTITGDQVAQARHS